MFKKSIKFILYHSKVIKIRFIAWEINKIIRYKLYIFLKSLSFKKYKDINLNNVNEFYKNKFIIIKNFLDINKCDEIISYSLSKPSKKTSLEGSLIEYEFNINKIKTEIEEVRKIVSNQMGFDVDIAYDEIVLYETSRIENVTSSFMWHRDGHYERYKLQILLTRTSADSALEFDIGTHEINLKNEYEETRFKDYKPVNSKKFIGEIGDAAIFTTSLIHRAGNCKKNEKRIVLIIPFLSEKKYL